jgi:outer membrane protein
MNSLSLAEEHADWDLQIGTGVAYLPDYSGAKASSPRLRIWADGAYRSGEYGTFAIDSGSLTIDPEVRWAFLDKPDFSVGLLVGYRSGRNDKNPNFTSANNGSTRLAGLPDIDGTIDAGIAGHVTVLGVPVFAQVRSATRGSQGTLVHVGAYMPIALDPAFELTLLPTATWANGREMRAFYGVTDAQSSSSGFAAYSPNAGWENIALEVSGDWHVSGGWHLLTSIAAQRLLDSAAASPLVQAKTQISAFAGVAWNF